MAIRGGYLGRLAAASIILSADFVADLSGAPVANDSVETAIEKLLGMINSGEELSFATTASAAGTTTLTVNSASRQELTGVTTQNFKLPNATTLSLYQTFVFINKSTGTATIQYADASTLQTAVANTYTIVICTSIGTSNGVWTVVQLPALASGVLANGFTTATSANTASAIVARDASKNFITNNIVTGITSTATAAGTTTLTVTSTEVQEFTGVTTQNCKLPDATTLSATGHGFFIINNSTGTVTIQYADASTLLSLTTLQAVFVKCTSIGTSNGTWVTSTYSQTVAGAIVANLTGNVTGNTSGSSGSCTGNAATATILATTRAIYGNNFDGSVALTQIIASTYGGTGNGFTKFSGPTTSEKTFTLPDASATLATTSTGTITPTDLSGAGLTFSNVTSSFTKVSNIVSVHITLDFPVTADATSAAIGGFETAIAGLNQYGNATVGGSSVLWQSQMVAATGKVNIQSSNAALATNADLSNKTVSIHITYLV